MPAILTRLTSAISFTLFARLAIARLSLAYGFNRGYDACFDSGMGFGFFCAGSSAPAGSCLSKKRLGMFFYALF